jgi:hypothetical protein
MPSRVLAVVIAILAATPALPQCSFNPILSAQFRSTAFDLAIDGNDLWMATGYGITLEDRRTDPPQFVTSLAVPGITRVVRVANGIAYAGSGSSLYVIRKSGSAPQIVRTIDAGGMVNDILLNGGYLYAATNNGIEQFDLLDMSRTSATFPTSKPAVLSLAMLGTTLYAADGDPSVEVFTLNVPSVPQRLGSFDSLPTAIAVRSNNGKLFVSSSGLSTNVFIGTGAAMTNAGTVPFPMLSIAPISGDAVFTAGGDRRLRGVDFTTASSALEIFRTDLPPTNGTVNRINALATADARLYVAAGDLGVQTYDIAGFSPPFPLRAYSSGGATSIFSLGEMVYVTRDSGGITEFSQSPTGALTQARSWDGSRQDILQDGATGLLLTSSGTSLTLWSLIASSPAIVATATFRAPVVSASLIGTAGYAVLSDRSAWSADFSQIAPAPQLITIPAAQPSFVARSGSALAFADLRADGSTALFYYPTPDVAQTPQTATVAGLATSGVSLDGNTAAVFTFRGISLVNFANGSVTVLPQSTTLLARKLLLASNTLYEITDSALLIWDTTTQKITRQFTLPADPVSLHVGSQSTIVDIATTTGVITVAANSTTAMPAPIVSLNSNSYYKKVVAGSDRIYLFDGRSIDIFTASLHYVGSVKAPGIVDLAASDSALFTVSSNLTIAAYTTNGDAVSTSTISAGGDTQALSIAAVNGAPWVSIITGCSSGGNCQKKTLVFDPRAGLAETVALDGGTIDVVASSNRAYAISDLPSEIRVFNIADPYHPSLVISRAAETTPVSISWSSGVLYVLGDKLISYDESTLNKVNEILGSYAVDPTGIVTFADQHLRIDGGCAAITGRSFAPQLFSQWTPVPSFPTPSPARSLAGQPGTFYFLTDHSLEIWSTHSLPRAGRMRAVR